MLKNDPDYLLAIADDYASGATHSLEELGRRHGCSVRSLFEWMRDKSLTVAFMGREQTFGQAMQQARTVAKAIVVSRSLESYVAEGRLVQCYHAGEPIYEDDEEAVAVEDLDVREMLFGYRDGKKRDAQGRRIIRTRREYAPAALIEKYASANLPGVYGNKSEVTMKGGIGVAVTAVGVQRPLPPEVQAKLSGKVVETTQVPQQIGLATDTPVEVFEPDTVELDPPPPPPPVERVIRDVPTAAETPPAQTGLLRPRDALDVSRVPNPTPLQQSLYEAIDAARARRDASK